MSTQHFTASEAAAFAQRLDAFALELTPSERAFLTELLRDAEAAQTDHTDDRTPGDIAFAIHRMHRSPAISRNPQPMPPGIDRHLVE